MFSFHYYPEYGCDIDIAVINSFFSNEITRYVGESPSFDIEHIVCIVEDNLHERPDVLSEILMSLGLYSISPMSQFVNAKPNNGYEFDLNIYGDDPMCVILMHNFRKEGEVRPPRETPHVSLIKENSNVVDFKEAISLIKKK